jgi:hypothetical protein
MATALPISQSGPPLLRVVTPQALVTQGRVQDDAAADTLKNDDVTMSELARHVRTEFDIMRNHRNTAESGWSERMLKAQRVFNGKYDASQLAAIKQFGGSDVYVRTIALKCRGASALMREVYLSTDRPWGLDPTPDPVLPDNVLGDIQNLVSMEAQGVMQSGQPLDINALRDRVNNLVVEAKKASKARAKDQAKSAEDRLDDLLVEGGFYEALAEFIVDLPLFPFACMKGPTVRIVPDVVWQNGKAVTQQRAKMFWNRVSPFDVFFTPGVSSIEDAAVIERTRLTRADLNDVLGLPGYNDDAIRAVLDDYGRGGLHDWMDSTDSQRATTENRENPNMNRSGMIDCAEFHGNVQGRLLLDYGFSKTEVPDELRDYFVQVWLIGRHVIKAQISPNPRKRHPYYITSFEKVPGTPVGNALPDILEDIGDICNATARALVNNLSISSGPQVVVDEERLSPLENGDELYPWKRWRVKSDPMVPQSNAVPPVSFFQPQSNANELVSVFGFFTNLADEISAIPRYITGSDKIGGAGRTASGLAMLMGNANKVLQMVAGNVDSDVIEPLLISLYDMVMLTDTSGTFKGDEAIRVRGVEVAVQRETHRQRQIEALQATMNPFDVQIMGPQGRAKLLRAVLDEVGIEGDIIPPDDEIKSMAAQLPPPGGPPGAPPGLPGGPPGASPPPAPTNTDMGVPDAGAMRGMAGKPMSDGGLVEKPKRKRFDVIRDEKGQVASFEEHVITPVET